MSVVIGVGNSSWKNDYRSFYGSFNHYWSSGEQAKCNCSGIRRDAEEICLTVSFRNLYLLSQNHTSLNSGGNSPVLSAFNLAHHVFCHISNFSETKSSTLDSKYFRVQKLFMFFVHEARYHAKNNIWFCKISEHIVKKKGTCQTLPGKNAV